MYLLHVFGLQFHQDSTFKLFGVFCWFLFGFWFFFKICFRQSVKSDSKSVLYIGQPLKVFSVGYFTKTPKKADVGRKCHGV